MLEDHSSRWSAAASPGGMIAGVLTILSLIVAVGSTFALLDLVQFEISGTILSIILGVTAFLTLTFVYLLISYIRMGYTLDSSGLTMSWGLWRTHVPYDEIEAVESAADVLGEQDMGWQLFWPGYYVGTRKTDIGDIQVVATLPPRRQLLIARTDGVVFAISPERPLLFTEELIRWHRMFHDAAPASSPESEPVQKPVSPPRKRRRPPQPVPAVTPEPVIPSAQPEPQPVPEELRREDPPREPQPEPVATPEPVRPAVAPSPQQVPEPSRRQDPPREPQPAPVPPAPAPRPEPRQERPDAESSPSVEPVEPVEPAEPPKPEPDAPSFGYQQPVATPQPPESRPQHVREDLPPPAPVAQPAPSDEPIRAPESPDPIPEPPATPPGPVFGTSRPADQDPAGGQQFGAAAPAVAPAFGIPVHVELEPLPEPEIDPASEAPTAPYEVWFPDPPSESEQQVPFTPERENPPEGSHIPFTAPKPVLAPAGRPRSEVLQPLTRAYRQEPDPVSPAIRPMLHRDSFAMTVAGIGLVSAVVMVGYIALQYDDIPPSLTLHWNVDGLPGRIGEPQEIWILPVIAGLVLLANLGLAWSIAQFDRFAARLLISSTLIVHIVTWLAVVMLLN